MNDVPAAPRVRTDFLPPLLLLAGSFACGAETLPDGGSGGGSAGTGATVQGGFAGSSAGGTAGVAPGGGGGVANGGTTAGGTTSGGATSGGTAGAGATSGAAGAPGCPAGTLSCAGGCVDLLSDPGHCGACGQACPGEQVCSAGQCQASCLGTQTQCGQSCVDTNSDPAHCGGCGVACPSDQACTGGSCASCSGSLSPCGGRCVNTNVDVLNCGACGMACPTGALCTSGSCFCASGQTLCGTTCAALDSDPNHCGTCGNRCDAGEACGAGLCLGGGGGTGGGGPVSACGGSVTVNPTPFGCELAWGANGNNGNRSSYLDFITAWVGYETNGGLNGACDGCGLARQLQTANARAVYYAYFIGYQARTAGYGDCNTDNNENLCTHGAQWIKSNRQRVVDMYANYSRLTQQASPNKGVVWLLEGDFIQYTYSDQTSPLTMQELGQLTSDIVCAIKSNSPNAAVALNHSTWIRNPQMSNYFTAMPLSIIDMVWTTGMGNVSGGYFNDGDARNRTDGTYTYLSTLTGKKILADTSFGVTSMNDSWTGSPVATLNQRIADGVIAVNVTEPPGDYQSRVQTLGPQLASVCQ